MFRYVDAWEQVRCSECEAFVDLDYDKDWDMPSDDPYEVNLKCPECGATGSVDNE